MDINFIKWSEASEESRTKILRRSEIDISNLLDTARSIIDDVKNEGDEALFRYIEKFDKVRLDAQNVTASVDEQNKAEGLLSPAFKESVRRNIMNVRTFHEEQIPTSMKFIEIGEGIFGGEKWNPIDSVAIYVPRGKGSFPSVLYMLAIPALVAGVRRIVVATPPGPDGNIDAGTLFTAKECSITELYKVGGIQGIAALAFGTESIPKVEKIIGPGSKYVTAAKRILYGTIDVGLPAGPSESLVVADNTTNPELAAIDLLIESEHGPDSSALLVTDSEELAKKVLNLLPSLIEEIQDERRRNYIRENMAGRSGVIVVDNMEEAVDFVNEYSPEHLELLMKNPIDYLPGIRNAGEILIGEDTPISLANFSIGPNAILPTGGFAKTFSPVSVRDFIKYSSIAHVTKKGFKSLGQDALHLAEYEGFPAHAAALRKRLTKMGD